MNNMNHNIILINTSVVNISFDFVLKSIKKFFVNIINNLLKKLANINNYQKRKNSIILFIKFELIYSYNFSLNKTSFRR